jgi:hypothetical protein
MKKNLLVLASAVLLMTACKKDLNPSSVADESGTESPSFSARTSESLFGPVTLASVISTNRTLSKDTLYEINGKVCVTGGATLRIPAGTRIEGLYNADPNLASCLIITKTGKLICTGGQTSPVVFTSSLKNLPSARTTRQPGDWGGIVILGDAPSNKPTTQVIEGINSTTVPEGVDVTYGGQNALHNGGSLQYVRIEFAGAAIAANNELNSLTLGGVGSQTTLRYIITSNGADDAFEFFAGTVNARYLIANSQNDDAFDFDFGYRGTIQFGISVRNPALAYADANGIECDNDGTSSSATPTTRPELSNLTIVGREALSGIFRGARFRRQTDLRMRNSIIMAYPTGATFENTFVTGTTQAPLFYRDNATHGNTVDFSYVAPTTAPVGSGNITLVGTTPTTWLNNWNAAHTNTALKTSALVYKSTGPLAPTAKAPNFTGMSSNIINTVPYIGALGPGSPVRVGTTITVPNNWVAGSAGTWVDFAPL